MTACPLQWDVSCGGVAPAAAGAPRTARARRPTTATSSPPLRRRKLAVTTLLFALIGLLLAIGRGVLITGGGSWYHLLDGLGLLLVAALAWQGRGAALSGLSIDMQAYALRGDAASRPATPGQ